MFERLFIFRPRVAIHQYESQINQKNSELAHKEKQMEELQGKLKLMKRTLAEKENMAQEAKIAVNHFLQRQVGLQDCFLLLM